MTAVRLLEEMSASGVLTVPPLAVQAGVALVEWPARLELVRSTRWQVAMAHGHYEPPETRANPLRPSWVFGDEEIAATGADYLALGHWDRPTRVGNGVVPAFYSGSPELARTVNLVRLTAGGEVVVTREALIGQS